MNILHLCRFRLYLGKKLVLGLLVKATWTVIILLRWKPNKEDINETIIFTILSQLLLLTIPFIKILLHNVSCKRVRKKPNYKILTAR